ncbi:MAG: rRNA adenine N-6-methyltransferase family protein [Actinomycetota bacterium]
MARSRRRWGWHELEPEWADRLVDLAAIRPGQLVLDIGAGRGAITAALVAAGARVVAVELHPQRAETLRRRFADDAVTVVRTDAADLRLPRRPFRVVANPSFAGSSAVVRRLVAPGSRLVAAHLVLQQQAAVRWSAPDAPGAGRWHRTFDARPGAIVPRSAFRPPPRVDTTVLVIERRSTPPTGRSGAGRSQPGRRRTRP